MLVDIYCHTLKAPEVRKELEQRKIETLPRQVTHPNIVIARCKRKVMPEIELILGVQCIAWAEEPEDSIICPHCGKKIEV